MNSKGRSNLAQSPATPSSAYSGQQQPISSYSSASPQGYPQQSYQPSNVGGYAPVPQQLAYVPPPASEASFVPPSVVGRNVPQNNALMRKRTLRLIPLTPQGNLVIDVPVPDRVLKMAKFNTGEEFTHTRYTAVTCAADDFPRRGYSLRQQEYGRPTELFIVVTMYNEDDFLFCKTMEALMKNIAYLCSRSRSHTWGKEGWKKAVICIVSDGRSKINPRVLDVLGIMGVYQEGVMKDHVNEKPVTAHLFEYTTQISVSTDLKVHGHEKGFVPIQILFCLKEKNAKKINSHRWFFNAFGPLIRPNVCILIDVGTKPTQTSLYHLWKTFDKNVSVGGACGEIYAELGTGCSNLLNPLVAAQNFEYKMSNILDKPLESVCGYISVLPGAFSAYRYVALQGKPLEQYFKGETLHDGADIFAANMYLAEDRILCFEICTKQKQSWLLKYVKSAKAETDVPDNVPEFISQRRRWLNGSFFAGVHALTHWYYIFRSRHSILRKMLLMLEFLYNFINLLFNWFGLSSFYLTFTFLFQGFQHPTTQVDLLDQASLDAATQRFNQLQNQHANIPDPMFGKSQIISLVFREIYIMAIVLIFICSLGNRPQGSKFIYVGCIFMFGLIMACMLYLGGYSIFATIQSLPASQTKDIKTLFESSGAFRDIVLALGSTYGLYFISSFLYFEPWHMFTSFIQYLFFLPSFTNILNVYAFCNLHDVSWGTKGDNSAASLGGVKVVKGKDGKETVEVEVPEDHSDVNANYETFIKHLRQPRPNEKQSRDAKTKQEDYFRAFRTRVVLFWIFSNALLIIMLTTDTITSQLFQFLGITINNGFNPYLKFIFYSVLGLSSVRFIGSITYLILNLLP